MVTLYLLGRLVYRERNALNTIGFAALCLLVVSPRSLFDSSLQMTLLAVVAIAGVAAPLLQGTVHPYLTATRELRLVAIDVKLAPRLAQFRVMLRMIAGRLQAARIGDCRLASFSVGVRFCIRVVELVVVSCVVELAMTLPMAVYFHRITLFALPVNLLILPLLAVLMPAALLTLLAADCVAGGGVVPAMVVALVLHFGVGLVHLFGSLALGDFRIPGSAAVAIGGVLRVAGGAPLCWRMRARAERHAGRAAPHGLRCCWRRWQRLCRGPSSIRSGALLVEAIDVGQGDSLLLITPDGKTLLVDGGGFGGGPRQAPQDFDIGEEVVSPALWARGIRHLDAVALSHAHSDHMGGLPAVLRNFHPDELWVGNNPPFAAYNALLDEAAALHVRVRSFRAGDAFAFGGTQVERAGAVPRLPARRGALQQRFAGAARGLRRNFSDAGRRRRSADRGGDAGGAGSRSTLLKVGHHGSITSTRPEFLARVAPQWAVISCGLHNRYGHPREEVLEELQKAHICVPSAPTSTASRVSGWTARTLPQSLSCESDLVPDR